MKETLCGLIFSNILYNTNFYSILHFKFTVIFFYILQLYILMISLENGLHVYLHKAYSSQIHFVIVCLLIGTIPTNVKMNLFE